MILALLAPIRLPFYSTTAYAAEAKAPGISKRNLSIVIGKTATLQIKGTNEKVIWSSGDPKIVTVDSETGMITAQAIGKVKIYGRVKIDGIQKVYSSNITVKPFSVKKASFGKLTGEIPKTYTIDELQVEGSTSSITQYQLHPTKTKDIDAGQVTILTILPIETNLPALDYSELKIYAKNWFKETQKNLNATFGKDGKVKKYKMSDISSTHGKAVKMSFDYHYTEYNNTPASFSTTIYLLSIDNFTLQITYINNGDGIQPVPTINSVAEHLLNTIKDN